MNYYLARAQYGEEDQSQRFLDEGIWEMGHGDDKFKNILNGVAKGDIVILAGRRKTIIGIGKCTQTMDERDNKRSLEVEWFADFKAFTPKDKSITSYVSTINKINKSSFRENIIQEAMRHNNELASWLGISPKIHKIKTLSIENIKAFKEKEILNFDAKNVLIYGENGSGKTSISKALQLLVQSSVSNPQSPQFNLTNIFSDTADFEVEMTLNDDNNNESYYVFNQDQQNNKHEMLLEHIAYANPFLNFKAILQIYFDDILNSQQSNGEKKNLFPFFRHLLSHYPIGKDESGNMQKLDDLPFGTEYFNKLLEIIERLKSDSNEYLRDYFKEDMQIQGYTSDIARNEIFMNVSYRDQSLANYIHILNEARLSSLAISIYFLTIKEFYNLYESELKVLVLDDLLISLDMSHRLPVLDILQHEFKDVQIIFLTHDKVLFEFFKSRTNFEEWTYFEVYTLDKKINFQGEDLSIEVPYVMESANDDFSKAQRFFAEKEYECCAIYIRKTLECICDKQLAKNEKRNENCIELDLAAKLDKLASKLDKLAKKKNLSQEITESVKELQRTRKEILNPASHSNADMPIFATELQRAIELTEKLKFELKIPNESTIQALNEDVSNHKAYNSVEAFMADLDSDKNE